MSWILNEEAPLRVQLIRFHWPCSILLDGTAFEITVNICRLFYLECLFFDGDDENADTTEPNMSLPTKTD